MINFRHKKRYFKSEPLFFHFVGRNISKTNFFNPIFGIKKQYLKSFCRLKYFKVHNTGPRSWHVVQYYRLIRFFAGGKLAMVTTAEEPSVAVKALNSRFRFVHPNRVARFYWNNIPKREKIYQVTIKYTKWSQNIPSGRKIDQIAIKYTNIFLATPSKIYPNWDFWLENMPPGNPAAKYNTQHRRCM
jgi:hypothetical protein